MTALAQHMQGPTFNLQSHRTKYNILIQEKLEITYQPNISPGANALNEVPTESIYQQTKLASYLAVQILQFQVSREYQHLAGGRGELRQGL